MASKASPFMPPVYDGWFLTNNPHFPPFGGFVGGIERQMLGYEDHKRACAQDLSESVPYLAKSYGPIIDLFMKQNSDGSHHYVLKNPDKPDHSHIITENVAYVLLYYAMSWDMHGTDLKYETWDAKLALSKRMSMMQRY